MALGRSTAAGSGELADLGWLVEVCRRCAGRSPGRAGLRSVWSSLLPASVASAVWMVAPMATAAPRAPVAPAATTPRRRAGYAGCGRRAPGRLRGWSCHHCARAACATPVKGWWVRVPPDQSTVAAARRHRSMLDGPHLVRDPVDPSPPSEKDPQMTTVTPREADAGRHRQRVRTSAGRVRPRPVAAGRQLGAAGASCSRRRATPPSPSTGPTTPPTVRRGPRQPRRLRQEGRRPGRRPRRRGHRRRSKRKPIVIGHSFGGLLAQIIAGRGLAARVGLDRPGPEPRRAAAAVLGAEGVLPGAGQPGQPRQGGDPDLRAVPLRLRQRGERGGGAPPLRDLPRARRRAGRCSRRRRRTSTRTTEAKADKSNPDRGPMLVVSGEKDHIVPWALANAAYKQQRQEPQPHRDRGDPGRRVTRWSSTATGARSPTRR